MIQLKALWPANDTIWKRWRSDCAKEKKILLESVKLGNDPVVKDLYKRKSIKKKFYFDTNGLFRGKCAYCETFIKDFQRGDIEHYRPKLAVTDEKDNPIMIDYGNGPEEHHGYYWLCYDQENLLPSCTTCNQSTELEGEKIGKHTRFPVVDKKYASNDAEIPNEKPLLINPLIKNPAKYLEVNTSNGLMQAIDGSNEGQMTIDVFGLNVRDQLTERRRGKIAQVKSLLVEIIHNKERREAALKELAQMRDGKGEYVAAVRAILKELGPFLGFRDVP